MAAAVGSLQDRQSLYRKDYARNYTAARLSSLIGPRISELCLLSMGEPVLYPFTPVVGRDVGFGVGAPGSW